MLGGFVVLDFGSQFTQLIARRLRELNVYSEILPFNVSIERIRELQPRGIFLSGGPSSVSEEGSPKRSVRELAEIAPLFGICYGMQLIALFRLGFPSAPYLKYLTLLHTVTRWLVLQKARGHTLKCFHCL